MSDASDASRALESLRDVEVPIGARSRVRARIEEQLDRNAVLPVRSRRPWLLGVTFAAVAAIVVIALWPHDEARAISVATGERYEVDLASSHVSIRGPADVDVERGVLALRRGTVEANGHVRVTGPACDVVVQGSAEVSVRGVQLTARVFAGSVEIVRPSVTCEVIDLSPRPSITTATAREQHVPPPLETVNSPTVASDAAPAVRVAEPAATASRPATPARSTRSSSRDPIEVEEPETLPANDDAPHVAHSPTLVTAEPSPPPDPLADAVAAYRAAVALEAHNPAAARDAWQAWRARWSSSPLAHSADLHLLSVLDRLGRKDEASELAREVVHRYPNSPRRAEIEHLIRGAR